MPVTPLLKTSRWRFAKRPALVCLAVLSLSAFGAWALFREEALTVDLHYEVNVGPLPAGGQVIKLWIPYPGDSPVQKVLRRRIESPLPWRLEKERRHGNSILYLEGKPPSESFRVGIDLEISRKADTGNNSRKTTPDDLAESPSIPFRGLIARLAGQQAGSINDPAEKIGALYTYVYETMTYSREGEGWGRGDPVWACASRRGNCTDFHSLFIAMARAQGIPARFEIGLPLPTGQNKGEIAGYHCWARVFEENRGWFPLDISESKKQRTPAAFFGKLPPDRILLSTGRDIRLSPSQQGEPLNFFFDPYAELDGKKVETVRARYYFEKMPRNSPYPSFSKFSLGIKRRAAELMQ